MRFIQGDSLRDAVRAFHAADRPGRDPGERALALRGLLRRFVDVCNAVAFAHDRGWLHRDIKPANVMLGRFGETLVVDWGLARQVSDSAAEEMPDSPEGSEGTRQGQAVGTPAYMSPEQAAGRWSAVGPRSDVYSLGATLYELLTGQAPFGGSTPEILSQVVEGALLPPRKRSPAVPAALDAVVRKAMAHDPGQRYESAQALAAEVERWLADEPVQAHPEPLPERLRRWGRRHRTLVASLAVLLVTATAALAVGLVVVDDARRKTEEAREATEEALALQKEETRRKEEAEEKTRAALEQSRKAEKSAAQQRQLALATIRKVVGSINGELRHQPGAQDLRKSLLREALEGLRQVARAADTTKQIDHAQVEVHLELGDLFFEIEVGGFSEAKRQYERAHELAEQLRRAAPLDFVALRDWYLSLMKVGNVHLRLGDIQKATVCYAGAADLIRVQTKTHPSNILVLGDLGALHDRLGEVRSLVGNLKGALEHNQVSLDMAERRARAEGGVEARRALAAALERIGTTQLQLGNIPAALGTYRNCLNKRQALAQAHQHNMAIQRDLIAIQSSLGDTHLERGDTPAALKSFQSSLDLAEALNKRDPKNAAIQRDLTVALVKVGTVHLQRGHARKALAPLRRAVEVREHLARSDDDPAARRDLAEALEKVGDAELRLDNGKAAGELYKRAMSMTLGVLKANPNSVATARELPAMSIKLGDLYMRFGRVKDALPLYRDALRFGRIVLEAVPASTLARHDVSIALRKIGTAQLKLGDGKAALKACHESLQASEQLVRDDPASSRALREQFTALTSLGDVQLAVGERKAAAQSYQRALETCLRLQKVDRGDVTAQIDATLARYKLGGILEAQGDTKAALEQFQAALVVRQRLAQADPSCTTAQANLMLAYFRIGALYQTIRNFGETWRWYERALEVARRAEDHESFQNLEKTIESLARAFAAAEKALVDPSSALKLPPAQRIEVLGVIVPALADSKQTEKLIAVADLLAKENHAGALYYAACASSLASTLADGAEARERHAKRAVDLLRQAIAKGYRKIDALKKDGALNALRGRDDFRKLLQGLESKAPAPR